MFIPLDSCDETKTVAKKLKNKSDKYRKKKFERNEKKKNDGDKKTKRIMCRLIITIPHAMRFVVEFSTTVSGMTKSSRPMTSANRGHMGFLFCLLYLF